jgi:biotin synthase
MDVIISWPLEELSILFACADQVRRNNFTNSIDPCSLMNIKSGGCSEDCAFCSQSSHNHTSVAVTELVSPDEIVTQAEKAYQNHLPFCVVSSGRRLSRENIFVVANSLSQCRGEKHASLGIIDDEDFKLLADAGVVCYNHNIETCKSFYPRIVTTHDWEERVETVRRAKRAGMSVCCGGILGLGEGWGERKELCLQLRDLDVDTVPLNFFNPIPGTKVSVPSDTPLDFLKAVCLFRLAMPKRTIKVCGGREVHLGPLQPLLFYAGANGYISGGYLTTSGAGLNNDDLIIKSLRLNKRMGE